MFSLEDSHLSFSLYVKHVYVLYEYPTAFFSTLEYYGLGGLQLNSRISTSKFNYIITPIFVTLYCHKNYKCVLEYDRKEWVYGIF